MSKFTRGKWIFDDEYIFTANKGRLIADVMGKRDRNEFNANGRLIASAPSMYRFLLEVIGNEDIYASLEDIDVPLEKEIEELLAYIDGDEEDNE